MERVLQKAPTVDHLSRAEHPKIRGNKTTLLIPKDYDEYLHLYYMESFPGLKLTRREPIMYM